MDNKFTALDHEPRASNHRYTGPPPAYKTSSEIDSWSEYSSASGVHNRRNSWTNLVDGKPKPTIPQSQPRFNYAPAVNAFPMSTTASVQSGMNMSRASSQIAYVPDNFQYNMAARALPVKAEPLPPTSHPAGTARSNISKASSLAQLTPHGSGDIPPKRKRNRLQDCKSWCSTPRHCIPLVCVLVLLVIGAIVAIIVTQVLNVPTSAQMSWLPPDSLQLGQKQPSRVAMNAGGYQIQMKLQGSLPFKGNYISYYDFKTNMVVVVDESLKSNGKNLACFVYPLDRNNIKDYKTMRRAADKASKKLQQNNGWNETWTWLPSPLMQAPRIEPAIKECEGARWIQLDPTTADQKQRKCSDCHDFCLPDYGIENDQVQKELYLNIIRRNCFYLFVPEWRTYAQAQTIEQNQRDFDQYYRNRNHLQTAFEVANNASKWINVDLPRTANTVMNAISSYANPQQQGMNQNVQGNMQMNGSPAYPSLPVGSNMASGVNGMNNGNAYGSNQNTGTQQNPYIGTNGPMNQYGQNQNAPNQMNGVPQYPSNGPYQVPVNGVNGYSAGANPVQAGPPNANGVYGVVNLQGVDVKNENSAYNMNGDPNTNSNSKLPMNGFGALPYYSGNSQPVNTQQPQVPSAGYVPDVAPSVNNQQPNPYRSPYEQPQNPQGYGNNQPNQGTHNNGYVTTGTNAQNIPQGIAGMQLPPSVQSSPTGYKPDVLQQNQQQQNPINANRRYIYTV